VLKGLVKYAVVTAVLSAGIAVAKQTDRNVVRRLVSRLHPVVTGHPLMRMGARGDGGYLIPDDLDGIAACFSPGVDNRASFEGSMIERGIPCFLADASVDSAPIKGDKVHFTRKHLGVVDNDATITLDHWVGTCCPGYSDLILQMDIEGAEWQVLLNVSRGTLRRFRIIVIELHDLERLMDKHAFAIIAAAFERLLQEFYIVHNHPNNYGRSVRCGSFVIPRVQEMTLLRKNRGAPTGFAGSFPHPLDEKNDVEGPDLPLPPEWYRQ
jgi:methyltransferase FkbM-like protein